jgi:recombination protein RecT
MEIQKTEQNTLRSLINSPSIKGKFEEMLGKRSASFLSSVISAVSTNKSLAQCEPMSVITAAAIAASIDLPINASLGFAHIVPYKNQAQFQMGWKGFIQLALRSNQYSTINLTPVYTGQIKNHNFFTGEIELSTEPIKDFGFNNQVGYLLYFKLVNGYEKYFYMTKAECESHGKKYSQSFKKGYGLWVDNFEAMALKTVAKMGLSKYGILSIEMQKAIESDQAVVKEDGTLGYEDNQQEEVKKISSLSEKLKEQNEESKS